MGSATRSVQTGMVPDGAQNASGTSATSERTPVAIWGVLNVTPDSFSDGGWFHRDPDRAVAHALEMVAHGASVIDVGGESSRPKGTAYGLGADEVPADEELARVLPIIERLVAEGVIVSVDTVKASVARAGLEAGAKIINDVSGGRAHGLLEAVAANGAEIVLMHNRGRGEVTPKNTGYGDVVQDVLDELGMSIERAVAAGVAPEKIWVDPGLGFAKTAAQSALLLRETASFAATGHRVLVGPSRKSFIAALAPTAGGEPPAAGNRLAGTLAAITLAVRSGANAVRVHDVPASFQATRLAEAVLWGHAEGGPP